MMLSKGNLAGTSVLTFRRRCVYGVAFVVVTIFLFAGCSTQSGSMRQHIGKGRSYTNPVYPGSMPDPSVIRFKDVYYAFGTTGAKRTRDGRIFTVLRSRDLVRWENLGGALAPPSQNEGVQYWAPEA